MKKYLDLIKNIGILSVSNGLSALLSFLLIPLYTNILTTQDYGVFDLYNTTIMLMIPILSMDISSAVVRFAMDNESYQKGSFTIGVRYSIYASIVFGGLIAFNMQFGIVGFLNEYPLYLFIMFLSNIVQRLFYNFAKALKKIKELGFAGIISCVVFLSGNLIGLLWFEWGLEAYFIANIMASIVSSCYIYIQLRLWKYISYAHATESLKKEILLYSRPLVFNSISWWVNNLADRYMVTWICGLASNGIYSVAYKMPNIINVFQDIFNQVWLISAVDNIKEKNGEHFFSVVYRMYTGGLFVIASSLIIFSKLFASILYKKEFYDAWKYSPFLIMAIMLGALAGYVGGIYTAIKDSKIIAITTTVGAVTNIVLNVILLPICGVIGAAVATYISYFMVWILRFGLVKKYKKIQWNKFGNVVGFLILNLQILLLFVFDRGIIYYVVQLGLLLILLMLHKWEIETLYGRLKNGDKI